MPSTEFRQPIGCEDRIAVARLETVAAFRRKATISSLRGSRANGISCRWFAHRVLGLKLKVVKSAFPKCARCWHCREDVGVNPEHPEICGRCVDNISGTGEVRHYA